MSNDTRENGEVTFDGGVVVDQIVTKLRNSARLTPAQRKDVERTVRRMVELKLQAVGASASELKQIRIEFAALRSTLTTIGETVGARSWQAIESVLVSVVTKGLEAAL